MKDKYFIYIILIIIIISTIILIFKENKKYDYDKEVYKQVYEEYNEIISKEKNKSEKYNNLIEEKYADNLSLDEAKNNLRLTDSVLEIPKINLFYPVIREMTMDNLNIAPTKFCGPDANEIGNYCIVGHNFQSEAHFSKLRELDIDDIVYLTNKKGKKLEYRVYDIYTINPNNLSCLSQDNEDTKELTLITCTNDTKRRLIIKCIETKEE